MILRTTQQRQVIGTWHIETPGTLENVVGFKLDHDITVRAAQSVIRGGISGAKVTYDILQDPDRSAVGTLVISGALVSGTAASTSGVEHLPINPVIPSGSWCWLLASGAGFPAEFSVTLWA